MSNETYLALIQQFCSYVGIEDAGEVLQTGTLEVDGVPFSLQHLPTPTGDALLIYCDYGPAPGSDDAKAYVRLLEINMFLSAGAFPLSFAVNPETGHVIFSHRMPLDQVDQEALADTLDLCAAHAKEWGRSHFLDGDSAGHIAATVSAKPHISL